MNNVTPRVRLLLVVIGVLVNSGVAQDIEGSWEAYLSTHAALNKAQEELNVLEEQASALQEDIASLQEKGTWVSGWLIKMRLARKTKAQVQLTDSLRSLRIRLESLEENRRKAFEDLRQAYAGRLAQTGGHEELSEPEREIGVSMVRLILSREGDAPEFPHYGSLLTQEFRNDKVKAMVLRDLRSVVMGKIDILDSLLAQRRSERELIQRVAEFHLALRMQSETEFDLGTGDGLSRSQLRAGGTGGYLDNNATLGPGPVTEEKSDTRQPSWGISSYEKGVSPPDRSSAEPGMDRLQSEILELESRRQEYLDLLGRIRDETSD